MAFYDIDKAGRKKLVEEINGDILSDLQKNKDNNLKKYFSDEDTYIRKTTYRAVGKLYKNKNLQKKILQNLQGLSDHADEKIRQTVINAAGEIGKKDFKPVEFFFEKGLFDAHHSVRNAVIGSIKKMGEKNPVPVLLFSKKFLHHTDPEIRREICHGIELRGRTHPQDILPLLKELQYDTKPRVRNTLVHVIGQISYKKGCLQTVISDLQTWENQALVTEAIEEIIDVHDRYKDFAVLTQKQALSYIKQNYKRQKRQ